MEVIEAVFRVVSPGLPLMELFEIKRDLTLYIKDHPQKTLLNSLLVRCTAQAYEHLTGTQGVCSKISVRSHLTEGETTVDILRCAGWTTV